MPRQDSLSDQLSSVADILRARGSYALAGAISCVWDDPHALRSLNAEEVRNAINTASSHGCYDAVDHLERIAGIRS